MLARHNVIHYMPIRPSNNDYDCNYYLKEEPIYNILMRTPNKGFTTIPIFDGTYQELFVPAEHEARIGAPAQYPFRAHLQWNAFMDFYLFFDSHYYFSDHP